MPKSRVLIVEDEILVSSVLADAIRDQGHDVVGPFTTKEAALSELGRGLPNAAVLDVKLADGLVWTREREGV